MSDDTTQSIRGSTVLFAGRVLALLISTGTQVLLVRTLSRTDFGAFGYALALATSIRTIVGFGEDQAFTRFLTMYDERKEYGRLFGTYVMAAAKVVVASTIVIVALFLASDALVGTLVDDRDAIALLLILVFLAPIDALDRMLEGSFAVFSRVSAIFVRKYVIEPGFRFLAVLLLVLLDEEVRFVAVGYVLAAAIGLAVYASALVGVFRRRGLLTHFRRSTLVLPFRDYFAFSLPLLTTELVNLSMNTVSIVLLGRYGGTAEVAGFRAVFPVARLNQLVIFTFTLLFTPLATRFFTHDDRDGMARAYWHTAAWLAVFTFPMLAVTVPMAGPTTVFLFGERYEDAALYLAVLSFGYYVNAAFGFNAMTLQVWGRLRWVVSVNVIAGVLNAVLAVILVPRFEAAGATFAIAAALVIQNVLNQAGLRHLGIAAFDRAYLRVYGTVAGLGLGLFAVQVVASPPLAMSLVLAGAASLVVIVVSRSLLAVDETFPELGGIPILGRLLGAR